MLGRLLQKRTFFIEKCIFLYVNFIEKCSFGQVNFIEKCILLSDYAITY